MTVEDWAGSGSYFEWLMSRPKSKRALSKGRACPPRTVPIQQLRPFPVFNQILRIQPRRRLKRRALGIMLLAFRERRSHVDAIARSTHAGAERKFKRCQR
jgi:hypothetical protein